MPLLGLCVEMLWIRKPDMNSWKELFVAQGKSLPKGALPELKKSREELIAKMNENARCCWYKCCKKSGDIGIPFKVCSGCAMSYYCSRTCQKKAWKYGHKDHCKKLRHQL